MKLEQKHINYVLDCYREHYTYVETAEKMREKFGFSPSTEKIKMIRNGMDANVSKARQPVFDAGMFADERTRLLVGWRT